jgi:hypothetical protein
VSYFTLRTFIILTETIKALYKRPSPCLEVEPDAPAGLSAALRAKSVSGRNRQNRRQSEGPGRYRVSCTTRMPCRR